MYQVFLRFYEELNDFLPAPRKKIEFEHPLSGKVSIKHLIESLGVPHTEVDLILVNHTPVDFTYHLRPNDHVSIYPVFESFDIAFVSRLRPTPLRVCRFMLDVHLGKLAVYLRFAGFDTDYRNDFTDDELARLSERKQRILLTRDRNLLKRQCITRGYYVRSLKPQRQIAEVFQRFHLTLSVPLQQRCTRCNTPLHPIPKAQILHRLLPHTRQTYQEYAYCQHCDQIYWKGSHYQRLLAVLESIAV